MQLPKVSIVITCFNLDRYIGRAIRSLLAQDCEFEYEIIVIDDASTDRSVEVIKTFLSDDRVRLMALEENLGAAAAINLGWREARGEYFCRFDGDDAWYPEYLRMAADVLDRNADVVLVHTDVSFMDSNDVVTSERNNISRSGRLSPKDLEFKEILKRYYINAPAIMARKSSWDKVLPWPEEFRDGLGDWFCTLQMIENEFSYFIDRPLAYYRIHQTNMHRSMILNGAAERNMERVFLFFQDRKQISPSNWNEIRFTHYRHLGFSYYAAGMHNEANRSLSKAVKHNPTAFFYMEFMRILFATKVGSERYERFKGILKRIWR